MASPVPGSANAPDPRPFDAAPADSPPDQITINGEPADVIGKGGGSVTIASDAGQIEIRVETHWWSFEIHLNQPAVNVFTELVRAVTHVVCEILPREVAWSIEVTTKLRTAWIKRVAADEAARSSPPGSVCSLLVAKSETARSRVGAVVGSADGPDNDLRTRGDPRPGCGGPHSRQAYAGAGSGRSEASAERRPFSTARSCSQPTSG
ncbi:hypothetical protein [Streptomyces sp. NPDC059256]|uniref:hypothetical protein n=1 Tax=Streptomyces sp. NPDC059256 TaxID=3346794 RepID=UPI00368A5350